MDASLGHWVEIRRDFKKRARLDPSQTFVAHNFNSRKQYPENGNLRPAIGSVGKDKATDAIDPPRCYTLYTAHPSLPGQAQPCSLQQCRRRAGASRPELHKNAVPFFSSSRESFVVDTCWAEKHVVYFCIISWTNSLSVDHNNQYSCHGVEVVGHSETYSRFFRRRPGQPHESSRPPRRP